MDFKSFINKESFKAVLLQHLKSQVNGQFGRAISEKLKECSENLQDVSSPDLISSVAKNVLESEEFPKFSSDFLKNVDHLLADGDAFVPKYPKESSTSHCSSASSFNVSSIDLISPDQFHDILQSLTRGTNAEKLDALGALHRLPSLEHISPQGLWSDIEVGLHASLSSSVVFLREQCLKLYVKMLGCPEPKVVQDSYLSLIKYFLEVLLPFLNAREHSGNSDWCEKSETAVYVLTILNKFLQTVSSHWLRYPQAMIESITMHSLKVFSTGEDVFPSWMCVAMCDPEAKWLKNLMHGHVSRAALINSLEKHMDVLLFAVNFCDKFDLDVETLSSGENICCQRRYLILKITHMVCFLSQLLQYCDGRGICEKINSEKVEGGWMNVLSIVMNCAHKLCRAACFDCCTLICASVSRMWGYIWSSSLDQTSRENLLQILTLTVSSLDKKLVSNLYLTVMCVLEILNTSKFFSKEQIHTFMPTFLTLIVDCCKNHEVLLWPVPVMYLFNSSLLLLKHFLLVPSVLFFDSDFIKLFLKWWDQVKYFDSLKLMHNTDGLTKLGVRFAAEMDRNISSIFIQLLRKPVGITLALKTSLLETCINILSEKILRDIKSKGCACPCDISVLSHGINSIISQKSVLSKTLVFKLSSVIWKFSEQNYDFDSIMPLKYVLEMLIPSIFCNLVSMDISVEDSSSDLVLFYHVLLFPNKTSDFVMQEDFIVLALQVISLLSLSVQFASLLESKFKITQVLLELQNNRPTIDENEIIDPVSILLNHILVKLYAVGGPDERNLPPEILELNCSYDWPFIREYPLPSVYYNEQLNSCESDIGAIVIDGNENLKDILLKHIHLNQSSSEFLVRFLKDNEDFVPGKSEEDLECMSNLPSIPLDEAELTLPSEVLIGLDLVQRYGLYLKLMDKDEEKLKQLLKASKIIIGAEETPNLDVFVCTLYLVLQGDSKTCFSLLNSLAKSYLSLFLWTEYLIQSSLCFSSKDIILHDVIFELCNLIVKDLFPDLYLIFQTHGILPSTLYSYWNKQCYWNYLNFKEISNFVLLGILMSGDFALYFFCSVLKHIHHFILQNAHEKDLYNMIVKNCIKDFKVCDYISYIFTLESQFHDSITKSIMQVLKQETLYKK